MIGAVLFSAIGQSIIASGRMARLVVATITIQAGTILVNVFLNPIFHVYTLPLSWTLMHLVVGLMLLWGMLSESKDIRLGLVEALLIPLVLGAGFFGLRSIINPDSLVFLLTVGFGGVILLVLAIRVFGFKEENEILTKIVQKLYR